MRAKRLVGMLVLCPCALAAQDLIVYDDALRNGFSDYSYGAPAADLAHGTTVRSGVASIALTPGSFNAVSLAHESVTFLPQNYRGVRLYVHGGGAGGQAISFNLYDTLGNVVRQVPLSAFLPGGVIGANEWREANLVFAQPPISYTGSFVRFDLQDGGSGAAQPTVYFDDIALLATAQAPGIFVDGFEGGVSSGELRFTAPSAAIGEAGGTLAAMVERVGGSEGAASVRVTSVPGTATAPDDYAAIDTVLAWSAGEAAPRTVQVAIVDDALDEGGGENFALQLSQVLGASLGTPANLPVTIVDDDALPPPNCGMTIDRDVTVASMLSDRFTWCDSRGAPRVAVLAHNDGQVGPGGVRGGALREFRYRMPNASERIATVTTYGNAGFGGFGYVVAHAKSLTFCVGDDSPLGLAFPGMFQRVFEGRHHAIFRFTQNYPRNCSVTGPAQQRPIGVTIDWIFATGRDHPLWSVTYKLDAYAAGTFVDDSRAPYGELNIDGDGFAAAIDGVAWGDRFKFQSTTAPVTLNSDWSWNQPNTVPYVKLWMVAQDATMGLVQSQTMTQQDAGGGRNVPGYDVRDYWGLTSASGNAGGAYRMPQQNEWPYQANAFSIGLNDGNNNARLTWGTQYGFLGPSTYAVNDGVVATAPGHPRKSYSVFVVLGPHSRAPIEAQVTQIETVQQVVASATIGSVDLAGLRGVAREDEADVTYQPAGYDPIASAWAFNAAGNALDANLAVGAGTLRKPLLIVRGYVAGLPTTLRLNGIALTRDVDWFPSLRADAQELWITLDRDLAGPNNRIEVLP
jgi:hypothetical protein